MKKFGLVLGSGGVRGFAHLGVLKTLQKNEIIPDYLIGSSVGAFIGGLFCKFGNYRQVQKILIDFDWKEFSSLLCLDIRTGLFKGSKLRKKLNIFFENINFEELKIPFEAVATNFLTAEPFYFNKGNVAEAIQASMAFPMLIEPLKKDKNIFWDGGLSEPLPVKRAKKMAKIVMAVNLNKYPQLLNEKNNSSYPIGIMAIKSLQHHLTEYSSKEADILIEPDLKREEKFLLNISSFFKKDKKRIIIERGSQAVEKNLKLIQNKLLV